MLVFEQPFLLVLLLLLPLAAIIRRTILKKGGRLTLALGTWKGPPHPSAPMAVKAMKSATVFLESFGFFLLVLAIAGPGYSVREEVALEDAGNLLFVLDESPTMAAQDFPPGTRFDVARRVIERFVRAQTNISVGLVTFAQNAALRVVPTQDYDAFLEKLWKLQVADLGFGTAIGMGMALGGLHLGELPGNRIMVLLTDGINNAGEILPDTAATVVRSLGIKLYVVGVGSKLRAPTHLINPETGLPITGTVEGAFSEKELQRISTLAGGTYFFAHNPNTLESVLRAIEAREATEVRTVTRVRMIAYQKHVSAVVLGIFLLVLFSKKVLLRELL